MIDTLKDNSLTDPFRQKNQDWIKKHFSWFRSMCHEGIDKYSISYIFSPNVHLFHQLKNLAVTKKGAK